MKNISSIILVMLPLWLHAQQGVVATGGEAEGSGGAMSSSSGLPDFYIIQSENHSMQFGLQQTYKGKSGYIVTFNIDMSFATGFDIDNDVVYVSLTSSGSMPEPGTDPENQTMTRVGEMMIWTKTLYLDAGEYDYKYFMNDGWNGGEWDGPLNRQITILTDTVLNDLWNHFRLEVAAQPEEGGMATGDGIYSFGMEGTVNAWPAYGYKFVHWTKGLEIVSTQETFNFFMPAKDITLTANFEIDEDACMPTDWIPLSDPAYQMHVNAQIYLYDEISFNSNDVLGAFVDGECRGIAMPDPNQNGLVFLTIGSNVISGEIVDLVIWDSENCEPCQTWQTLTFEHLEQVGDPENPYMVECKGFVEFSATMGEGFTWFSMNVDPGSLFLSNMMASLSPCENDRVIGQTIYAIFHENSWMGSLKEIDPGKSYKMHLCSNQELYLLGAPIPSVPMVISQGFTWMGYTPQVCIPINTALANIFPEPENNDRIIAQTSYAIYSDGQWMGSLKELCPGKGYVISLTHNTTLEYPENAGKDDSLAYDADPYLFTEPVAEQMQHTMTVLGQLISTDGYISHNHNDIVFALSGNERRGAARPIVENNGLLFMNIASNQHADELITFIAWSDDLQQYVEISETLTFESLKAKGNLESPFIFTMTEPLGVDISDFTNWAIGDAFPNPFICSANIPYTLSGPAKIRLYVYTEMGQSVHLTEHFQKQAGNFLLTFERGSLTPGVYLYRVYIEAAGTSLQKTGRMVIIE